MPGEEQTLRYLNNEEGDAENKRKSESYRARPRERSGGEEHIAYQVSLPVTGNTGATQFVQDKFNFKHAQR